MKELDEFFSKMALRLRKEPALSDITYTALETIPGFKKDFVLFFHPSLTCNGNIEVFREFRLESGGQPDFVFRESNSWDLIVENKIWDENYHFNEYGTPPLRESVRTEVGLIAVQRVIAPAHCKHWAICRWADFVDHFEKKSYEPYTDVFQAYLKYVRKVCNMAEFKKFKIDAKPLTELIHFVRMVERTLEASSSDLYQITVRGDYKYNFGDSWAGYFFDLVPAGRKGPEAPLFVWFGLDFSSEHGDTHIALDLHKGANSEHFARISELLPKCPSYEKKLWTDSPMIELRMPEERFRTINNATAKEEQLHGLEQFLKVCCEALVKTTQPVKRQ